MKLVSSLNQVDCFVIEPGRCFALREQSSKQSHEGVSKACHCGLDPQSHKKHLIYSRLRVKPAMTSIDLVQQ